MPKLEDIKQMSVEELDKELAKCRHNLLKAKIQTHSDQSQKTHSLKDLRITIARLETVKKELTLSAK